MKLVSRLALAASAASLLGGILTAPAQAQTAYAIANGGTTLIRLDVTNPLNAVAVGTFNGGATFLDGIDFRPANNVLYGYLDTTDTLYTVNLTTATLTAVGTGSEALDTDTDSNLLDLDFNPTIDRLRIVSDATDNLVYNPNNGAVNGPNTPAPGTVTPLFYPDGDVAETAGFNPLIIGNAYTNNLPGATTTVQYGIDYGTDSLVTIANNAGTLTTVNQTLGNLGVLIDDDAPFVGFDIFTTLGGTNFAYAILDTTETGTAPTLYTINLATGAATSLGAVGGGFTQVYGLAVTPAAPEPGTLALALLGGGALVGRVVVRRKRA